MTKHHVLHSATQQQCQHDFRTGTESAFPESTAHLPTLTGCIPALQVGDVLFLCWWPAGSSVCQCCQSFVCHVAAALCQRSAPAREASRGSMGHHSRVHGLQDTHKLARARAKVLDQQTQLKVVAGCDVLMLLKPQLRCKVVHWDCIESPEGNSRVAMLSGFV